MVPCLVIETPRVVLEPLEPAHADAMFEGLRNARLYEFIENEPPESVDNLRTQYARLSGRKSPDGAEVWLNWAVRESGIGPYVGFVQATVNNSRSALIAYVLFHTAWGKGYAREAVAAMVRRLRKDYDVRTFRATVDPRNSRSIAVLQSLGFTKCKLQKGTARIRGAVADELEFRLEVSSR